MQQSERVEVLRNKIYDINDGYVDFEFEEISSIN